MPYTCALVGGRPLLTPAPEQSHRVIGQREQRAFTACSPANPGLCRNWTVHRFDLDCDGARVPWIAVVASVSEQTMRRAWLEDGRLRLRMPASWSFEPNDPCARPPGFEDRFGFGRMRRYCADRRAMTPPPVVEMPIGFAPMLGIDGIFVRSNGPETRPPPIPAPSVAAVPPAPPKTSRTEPPQARTEFSPPVVRSEAPAEPPEKHVHIPPSPKVALGEMPAPQHPSPQATKPPQRSQPIAPPDGAGPTSPVTPRIINRPDTASTEATEQKQPGATAKTEPPRAEVTAASSPTSTKEISRAQHPSQDRAELAGEETSITVNLLNVARGPTVGIAAALGGLAVILLAIFALVRRRERLVGAPPHDIASVSLGTGRGHLVSRPQAPLRPTAPPRMSPSAPPVYRTPTLADRIPQTRAEALQVLGMGVSPDATETAIKKIVDGLRLTWHPDLAKDEADRRMREFRLKQINAAWELILGKRLERLDS